MTTTPPCAGRWRLFDSIDIEDHRRAAQLCAACPLIDACRDRLTLARTEQHATYGPQGTWAGELVGCKPGTVRGIELAAQEDRYTPPEVRAAHAAYNRGDRSEWATVGHRIYERTRKRKQVAA